MPASGHIRFSALLYYMQETLDVNDDWRANILFLQAAIGHVYPKYKGD